MPTRFRTLDESLRDFAQNQEEMRAGYPSRLPGRAPTLEEELAIAAAKLGQPNSFPVGVTGTMTPSVDSQGIPTHWQGAPNSNPIQQPAGPGVWGEPIGMPTAIPNVERGASPQIGLLQGLAGGSGYQPGPAAPPRVAPTAIDDQRLNMIRTMDQARQNPTLGPDRIDMELLQEAARMRQIPNDTTRDKNLNYLADVNTGRNDPGAPGWRGNPSTDLAFGGSPSSPIVTRGDRAAAEHALTARMLERFNRENPSYTAPTQEQIAAVGQGNPTSPVDPRGPEMAKYLQAAKAFKAATDAGVDPTLLPKIPSLQSSLGYTAGQGERRGVKRTAEDRIAASGRPFYAQERDRKEEYAQKQKQLGDILDLRRQGMSPVMAGIAAGVIDPEKIDPRLAQIAADKLGTPTDAARIGLFNAQRDRANAETEIIRGQKDKVSGETKTKIEIAAIDAGDDWEKFKLDTLKAGVAPDVVEAEGKKRYPNWGQKQPGFFKRNIHPWAGPYQPPAWFAIPSYDNGQGVRK